MAAAGEEQSSAANCLGWAARDPSGFLSPFNFSRRVPGPHDVSYRITHCGVCHAELLWTRNAMGHTKYPIVPGHEMAGIVTEVGSEVTRFKVGDRVGTGTYVNSCQDCEFCDKRMEIYCEKGVVFTYDSIDHDGTITRGGFSTHIVVHERYCVKIPDALRLEHAAPLLCAGITVYSPMMRHGMNKPGAAIGVLGLGGLGHMAVKFGKAFGAIVTVLSTSPSKKDEALTVLGADKFIITSNATEMQQAARSLDFIIDTAAADHPLDLYLPLLKTGGTFVLVGAPKEMKFTPSILFRGINHTESVKTRLNFENKDSMSDDQEKGMSLGNEKHLEVENIQEKDDDNEVKEIKKGSKDVSCTIEDDLNSKQVEKTTHTEKKNDSHTKIMKVEMQVVEKMLSSTEKEKGASSSSNVPNVDTVDQCLKELKL